jgi:hypothetical protein
MDGTSSMFNNCDTMPFMELSLASRMIDSQRANW